MTKFIKTLIIINGIIIPIVLIVLLISFLVDQFRMRNIYKPDPVMTENLITRDGDTLMAQGLIYNLPESIYNSTNFIIKIIPKTFKIPKAVSYIPPDYESGTYRKVMVPTEYYVNVLFLDSKFNLIKRLVNEKASIKSITIPTGYDSEIVDTTVKNIAYQIAFEDSNNDKLIDYDDNYDLFISDLNGENLIQVTRDIDIIDFRFINAHKEILITFTERTNIAEEHKVKRFAIYNINKNKLMILAQLDKALNEIQTILSK